MCLYKSITGITIFFILLFFFLVIPGVSAEEIQVNEYFIGPFTEEELNRLSIEKRSQKIRDGQKTGFESDPQEVNVIHFQSQRDPAGKLIEKSNNIGNDQNLDYLAGKVEALFQKKDLKDFSTIDEIDIDINELIQIFQNIRGATKQIHREISTYGKEEIDVKSIEDSLENINSLLENEFEWTLSDIHGKDLDISKLIPSIEKMKQGAKEFHSEIGDMEGEDIDTKKMEDTLKELNALTQKIQDQALSELQESDINFSELMVYVQKMFQDVEKLHKETSTDMASDKDKAENIDTHHSQLKSKMENLIAELDNEELPGFSELIKTLQQMHSKMVQSTEKLQEEE